MKCCSCTRLLRVHFWNKKKECRCSALFIAKVLISARPSVKYPNMRSQWDLLSPWYCQVEANMKRRRNTYTSASGRNCINCMHSTISARLCKDLRSAQHHGEENMWNLCRCCMLYIYTDVSIHWSCVLNVNLLSFAFTGSLWMVSRWKNPSNHSPACFNKCIWLVQYCNLILSINCQCLTGKNPELLALVRA